MVKFCDFFMQKVISNEINYRLNKESTFYLVNHMNKDYIVIVDKCTDSLSFLTKDVLTIATRGDFLFNATDQKLHSGC